MLYVTNEIRTKNYYIYLFNKAILYYKNVTLSPQTKGISNYHYVLVLYYKRVRDNIVFRFVSNGVFYQLTAR